MFSSTYSLRHPASLRFRSAFINKKLIDIFVHRVFFEIIKESSLLKVYIVIFEAFVLKRSHNHFLIYGIVNFCYFEHF